MLGAKAFENPKDHELLAELFNLVTWRDKNALIFDPYAGSGKTPMLALCANTLGDAIILWTTNRGAVISQTAANLNAGGRYAALLPEDAQILDLSDLSDTDWGDIVAAQTGLTIILSTVAAFNQDGDKLKIHQQRGDTSHWEMLAGRGADGRRRQLYIIYDEGHGATEKQFRKLTELDPRAIILASASPLPDDLAELLPGETSEAKSESLEHQTVVVPTPKTELYKRKRGATITQRFAFGIT